MVQPFLTYCLTCSQSKDSETIHYVYKQIQTKACFLCDTTWIPNQACDIQISASLNELEKEAKPEHVPMRLATRKVNNAMHNFIHGNIEEALSTIESIDRLIFGAF